MFPEITENGVLIQTYSEIVSELQAAYRAIYGQDIDLSSNTPDGQRIGIEAKARLDLQSYALSLYHSFDPDFAIGDAQDRLVKLVGIARRPATRSTWDITVETDRDLTLESGYTIKDDIGQKWLLTSNVNLSAGTTQVTFRSLIFGALEGFAGAVLQQDTVVPGVVSLSASGNATVGIDGETSEQLRTRRNLSLQNTAYSVIGSLYAKLANLAGVTDVAVYENETNLFDNDSNLDAHTIWAIVEGGAQSDIVETIAKQKTAGVATKGDEVGEYLESITRPEGSVFSIVHTMHFDRPQLVQVFVKVTATRKNSATPIDISLIAQKIAGISFRIGDDVTATELYDIAYQAGNAYVLTDLQVSTDNITYTNQRLIAAPDSKFFILVSSVQVTEII
ncbi:MAG: baseplate J/gp47 family protein [Methyloprofundus sp.]|nr:baseplate J/gp47 family protein [Methyloprofundus sp.]